MIQMQLKQWICICSSAADWFMFLQVEQGDISCFFLQDLRFSQQCCWTFKSSGMWCHVFGVTFPSFSKDCNAFIISMMHYKKNHSLDHFDSLQLRALWHQGHSITPKNFPIWHDFKGCFCSVFRWLLSWWLRFLSLQTFLWKEFVKDRRGIWVSTVEGKCSSLSQIWWVLSHRTSFCGVSVYCIPYD
jgi:hypothetical protein